MSGQLILQLRRDVTPEVQHAPDVEVIAAFDMVAPVDGWRREANGLASMGQARTVASGCIAPHHARRLDESENTA